MVGAASSGDDLNISSAMLTGIYVMFFLVQRNTSSWVLLWLDIAVRTISPSSHPLLTNREFWHHG